MVLPSLDFSIDEYLRKRLMPVEGAIPQLPGIEMYGNSIPAASVGGDLPEYINFQQRYDIDARIARALRLAKEDLEPAAGGCQPAQRRGPSRAVDRGIAAGLQSGGRHRVPQSKELPSSWKSLRICTSFTPQRACCWWMRRAMT